MKGYSSNTSHRWVVKEKRERKIWYVTTIKSWKVRKRNNGFTYHRTWNRWCQSLYFLLIFFSLVILYWYLASHLLHNGSQPPQSQATFIPTGDHSTAELDYDPLGLTQLTAVCKGAAVGPAMGNCIEGDVIFTLLVKSVLSLYFNVTHRQNTRRSNFGQQWNDV